MIVNGVDLKRKYNNVTWLTQLAMPRTVKKYADWLESGNFVKYRKSQFTSFDISIEMMITGNSADECEKTMSSLMADFTEGRVILDDMTLEYEFAFKEESRELLNRWTYMYTITLEGDDKYLPNQSVTFNGDEVIVNYDGTTNTGVVLSFISDVARSDITINGLTTDSMVIRYISAGKEIIIDTENGKVTEDGLNKVNDAEFWELPELKPGRNVIRFNHEVTGSISYKTRFL